MASLDRIIVDDIEQETSTEDPMVDPSLIRGDLRGIVTETTAARESRDERNAFVFRGLSIGDLALAGAAVKKALANGVGAEIG
tara:strand:- start:1254 stop:1502 length:249 start_codon:yes stop_codon:yes gene_type:complete